MCHCSHCDKERRKVVKTYIAGYLSGGVRTEAALQAILEGVLIRLPVIYKSRGCFDNANDWQSVALTTYGK